MDLKKLEELIRSCRKCPLHKNRTNAVPGEGGFKKRILLVGEAPGRNEDIQGRPFVGAAGKLLDSLLGEVGLSREDVYITNIIKCRPPNNRDPTDEEIHACTPYLNQQVELLNPRIIMTLGRFSWAWAAERFGLEYRKLTDVRGKVFRVSTLLGRFSVIPTFHPAAALRRRELTDLIRDDFLTLREELSYYEGASSEEGRDPKTS